ncbi:zinc ribbon domain-containing protein [Pseudomonas monteilii]|uniref:zinc ribbon domain-containing protein n=1 Tax=Pseudomonas sp. PCH44 TaxID=2800904 RepID=UPI000FB656BA|nr:zinc ribbon domain-containing protein [Pseudomonas sp. PCH44]RPD94720.1 zinc ribbon domain-containing protein [Pseudomonas monteilii]
MRGEYHELFQKHPGRAPWPWKPRWRQAPQRGHGAEQYDRHGRQQGCDGGNQVYDGGRPPTPAPIKDLQGCRQCRTANDPSARFCLNCGTPLSSGCTACGSLLSAGARFCSQCGQATL